ncbi:MAG TPA: hypothetical protein VG897_14175, partial [Terriglobales bacterium]|nr:hypothetical protein [Terriglobales bacterium]
VTEDLAAARRNAKTPEEKTLVGFWTRTFGEGKFEKETKRFRVSDGVDQFEAWLLVSAYFSMNVGLCGDVGLPKAEEGKWVVPIVIGWRGKAEAISVDMKSGVLTFAGYPSVDDPEGYIRDPKPLNQSPEPER